MNIKLNFLNEFVTNSTLFESTANRAVDWFRKVTPLQLGIVIGVSTLIGLIVYRIFCSIQPLFSTPRSQISSFNGLQTSNTVIDKTLDSQKKKFDFNETISDGVFKNGNLDGHSKVTYPGGTVKEGLFKDNVKITVTA